LCLGSDQGIKIKSNDVNQQHEKTRFGPADGTGTDDCQELLLYDIHMEDTKFKGASNSTDSVITAKILFFGSDQGTV
jgi:hypothetical protein